MERLPGTRHWVEQQKRRPLSTPQQRNLAAVRKIIAEGGTITAAAILAVIDPKGLTRTRRCGGPLGGVTAALNYLARAGHLIAHEDGTYSLPPTAAAVAPEVSAVPTFISPPTKAQLTAGRAHPRKVRA